MRTRVVILPVVAVAALSACGEKTIDAGQAESSIRATVSRQAGVRVKDVACPEGRKAQPGDRFTCSVTGTDGTKGDVTVVQRDDKGAVKYTAPFLHVREAERVLAQQLRRKTDVGSVKVTCPEIVVAAAGRPFDCRASDGKQTVKVHATQTDAQGHFNYRTSRT
jgi:hypothetical protein